MPKLDAYQRLIRARELTQAGKYAEALREHVWFHEHALDEIPSLSGVRLSFALSDWVNLAKVYPPALRKLKSIRDETIDELFGKNGSFKLFHDIASINEYLEETSTTHQAFLRLDIEQPELARKCADVAMDAIVAAKDFKLARRYWPLPEDELLEASDWFNADVVRYHNRPPTPAPYLDAIAGIYCNRILLLMRIARGLGYVETAGLIKEWAIALVDDRHARRRVITKLQAASSNA